MPSGPRGCPTIRRTVNKNLTKSGFLVQLTASMPSDLPLAIGQVCYAARFVHKPRMLTLEGPVDNYVCRHLTQTFLRRISSNVFSTATITSDAGVEARRSLPDRANFFSANFFFVSARKRNVFCHSLQG